MLLMISNNNMSLRELYTSVLDNHPAGWTTSFMSGVPSAIESIISGYDAIIYEIGPADALERVAAVKSLRRAGAVTVTHVEGRQAAQRTEELQAAGAYVVANPITGARINETIDGLAAALRAAGTGRHRVGVRERFRRLLGG
jgi:hypothetical protein